MEKKKVVVGMSGGVDSSVAALLLKKQGYEVIGITMNVWQREETEKVCEKACCAVSAVNDARRVCDKLDIPYYSLNFKDTFKKDVIDYFVQEYISGKTPNPCIACNKYVKFETLLNKAKTVFDAEYIATGHYAKVEYNSETGRYYLKESVTDKKDQTYALYNLTQEQLKHIIFPLGDYTKEEVRQIARENDLITANKQESQEICFVEDNDYAKFIKEKYNYIPKVGNFVDTKGNFIAKHEGIINYTIGQRRGLKMSFKKPMYVVNIDAKNDQVVLGEENELYKKELICKEVNFMPFEKLLNRMKVKAKIRYSAKKADATISQCEDGNVKVVFEEAQRAITPGQAVVFYDNDVVVGGGVIL
ncbi:MAG: tRNA 2-thiouridine(34) synthase MnmA [Clostridia bacterium]|nr:tRNA 2-thiouridine(34) synthase MnmA [Clostridia bacterium]